MYSSSIEKFKAREAKIGIIGMGYVGIPLMLRFNEIGFKTLGFDVDDDKISKLNSGKSYIKHISDSSIDKALSSGFEATKDIERYSECDALIICVPTPLNKYREPDLQFVINTMDDITKHLQKGQVISLESTTYPGTTEEELRTRIQSAGFEVGEDVFLIYSPEREDPGNPSFTTQSIPKVCGGSTANCLEVGISLYSQIIDTVVPVTSTKAAEMTKLLENIHRAVNIGLANEMKILSDRMGIDIREVIDAAATKPFGFTPYYPGPGLGGHCIPIDPFYLTWKAREYGLHTRFIELAGEINSSMPDFVVGKITSALNRNGKAIMNSSILVIGISYKRNIGDMRESPSVFIMEKLRDQGAHIDYSDPYVPTFPKMRQHHFDLESVDLKTTDLSTYDIVLIATDHSDFNYDEILRESNLIVDTRGVYTNSTCKVIKA